MYSPTTRLLTVLELLQSRKQMSGSELARRLQVDPRTVRRYIVMLQDMGIPVEGERGPYGAYQLRRGFKLPPLMFTDAEAVALTMGLLAIREYRFPLDVAAVEGALAKTERVLPENLLHQIRGLQEAITFNIHPPPAIHNTDLIATLSAAVQQRQQVHMRYEAWGGDISERAFDPYGILFNDGYWYTAGYCHLRQDLRTFRLDRIVGLMPLEERFERPADFDMLEHVMNSIVSWQGVQEVQVLMETTMERAQEVISPIMGMLEATDKGILFRRSPSQLEWIASILLLVDFPVHVYQPIELRNIIQRMGANAREITEDEMVG
jgi:predicted DNA-binding transcriptional regulator YafY